MSWQVAAGMNLVIALAYFAICATIMRGLVATGQLRENPLALATGAIFFTCAVHHGAHTVHMLAPLFGADVAHGLALRSAFGWQSAAWDGIGAAVAVYYLTLRRTYVTLLHTPEMFRDEVRLAASERVDRERAMLADAEELTRAGSFERDIATGTVHWSTGMYRLHGIEGDGMLPVAQADQLHRDDRQRVHGAMAAALTGDATVFEVNYRIVRPDREVRWLETRNRIERDDAGMAVRARGTVIDVTMRRESDRLREHTERAVRERERLLHSVINNDRALIYVKDLDGRYLLYNNRFAEAFGLVERGEAEGLSADQVLLGRDDHWLDPVLAPVWRENDLRARDRLVELDEFSEHPERGRLTYASTKFPLFDDDGSTYAICGVSTETTERMRELDQLAQAARYFELSRDLLCTAGFDGVFRQLNSAWTSTLGWSEEELRSRPFVEFVHPDDRELTVRETAGLAAGGVTIDFENRYATKDGGWRWIDWRSVSVVEDGLIYASARDVTERKSAELALEASERHTRLILETAHDAFIGIDANGLITDWNPRAEAVFGWSAQAVVGRELAETVIPEAQRDAHRGGLARFLATGLGRVVGDRLELTALHRDGRVFPIELTISALAGEGGYSFTAFVRDISERQQAQRELAQARDNALEASRMKSMFVANVSHEIRTPMNGVIGMTEVLLQTELDEAQREYAEMIAASGEALLEVIDDILDFSKIEAGKLELDATDFELRQAIERACGLQAARAQGKGLELVVAIDPDVPIHACGDAARLRQVISNFLSNAIKFTAAGEIVVRVRMSRATAGDDRVRIDVSDTGIGIDAEALQRLFRAFTQADGSTTRKYGGTGLGLAISRQLIELMGGAIGAESKPGKGSTFWCELPAAASTGLGGSPAPDRRLAGLRVLVVDDNAASRSALRQQLEAQQMRCVCAEHAAGAVEVLESGARAGQPYALALLDLGMPGVNGNALARIIRKHPALHSTKLILLTPAVNRDGAEEVTFDAVLAKPIRGTRLADELHAVIAGERPELTRHTARTAETGAPGSGASPHVLVVLVAEDMLVNQTVIVHMLKAAGIEVEVVENGRLVIEAMSQNTYAAVLMDCQMPELDGYETTREIRRRERDGVHIPIIAMTANSMQGDRERCLAAGMDDYLTKPLRTHALKDALRRWIKHTPPNLTPVEPTKPVDGTRANGAGHPELLDEAVIADLQSLDGDLLAGLVSLYFREASGHTLALRGAIDRNDALGLAQTAHKLRGGSATIGAAYVAHIASLVETSAKAGDLSAANEHLQQLGRAFEESEVALRRRIPARD